MGPEKCRLFSLGWNLSRLQGGDSVWVRDGIRVCVPSQDKPNGPDAGLDSFGGLERRACSGTSEEWQLHPSVELPRTVMIWLTVS